jgi:hypothetical protein
MVDVNFMRTGKALTTKNQRLYFKEKLQKTRWCHVIYILKNSIP